MTHFLPALRTIVDLSGPVVLLGWGWLRWKRDPYRASAPRWRNVLALLSLLAGSAGAILFAAIATGYVRSWTIPGFTHFWPTDLMPPWPITSLRLTLVIALTGFLLSFANRGLTRFLVCAGCLWLAFLSWVVCCMPQNMDLLIDWLERVF